MANWASTARLGDSSTPEWQRQNLTWIEPVKGQRWQVYTPAQQAFEGLLTDLVKLGYHPTSSGGFNYRNIRGSDKLSQHAFGTAIDLNAMTNAMGQSVTDIPQAAELAKKWGLEWGGNWKGRPDPMHFEYAGARAPYGPLEAAGGGQRPDRFTASPGGPVEAAGGGAGNEGGGRSAEPGGASDADYRKAIQDALADRDKKLTPMQGIGEALLKNPFTMSGGAGPGYNLPQVPGPALAQTPPTSMVNPQAAEARRAGLAAAMARLNAPAEAQAAANAQRQALAQALKGLV